MAYPQKLLAPDEKIQFETRPHWRALFVPIVILLATVFGMTWLYFWIDNEMLGGTFIRWVVLAGGILILVLWAIVPFLRWLTTEYVFTDRRIIVRSGIITRHGKDMPLAKVNNVSFFVPAMGRHPQLRGAPDPVRGRERRPRRRATSPTSRTSSGRSTSSSRPTRSAAAAVGTTDLPPNSST